MAALSLVDAIGCGESIMTDYLDAIRDWMPTHFANSHKDVIYQKAQKVERGGAAAGTRNVMDMLRKRKESSSADTNSTPDDGEHHP